jgi:hypothetical protein
MSNNLVNKVSPPALPLAQDQYSLPYQDQLNNVLRLYFTQLNSALNSLVGDSGGRFLQMPYLAIADYNSHTVTANTANAMTFGTTDFANGISLVSTSQMTAEFQGLYNLQFSTQFQNTDTQLHDVSIWLRINGVDVTGSTGFISIPSQHGGTPGHAINGWNFFVPLNAGDYVEIWWSTNNVAVTIQTYAANTGPVRPSTASNVATLTFVSAYGV